MERTIFDNGKKMNVFEVAMIVLQVNSSNIEGRLIVIRLVQFREDKQNCFFHRELQAWSGQAAICPLDLGLMCSTDSIIRQFIFRRFSHLKQLLKKINAVDVVVSGGSGFYVGQQIPPTNRIA